MKNFFRLAAGIVLACTLLLKVITWLQPARLVLPLPGLELPAGILGQAVRCSPLG